MTLTRDAKVGGLQAGKEGRQADAGRGSGEATKDDEASDTNGSRCSSASLPIAVQLNPKP
jgi:hypothetical protein